MTPDVLLTILIPSFNGAGALVGALESIAQQTFTDFEVLVIDGGSRDNTTDVITAYAHLPIRFYSEPDEGIYDAINKGIGLSRGAFIYVLGCDDRLAGADVLASIFTNEEALRSHVVYGNVRMSSTQRIYDGKFTSSKLVQRNICHQAIFTHRTVFERLGRYERRYRVFADWEFNMRWFYADWVKKTYLPVVVAHYTDTGFSARQPDEAFWQEHDQLLRQHLSAPAYLLRKAAGKLLPRRLITLIKEYL